MVLRIYGVQFGYNAIHLTEDLPTIDLTKRLGLTAQELSNVKFNDVAVTDITSFAATENGTLTFDVAKDGYVATSMSLEVTYTAALEYNPLCSIENPDLSKWSLNSTTAGKADTAAKGLSMVAGSDANGAYIEFTTTGGEWPNIRYLTSAENATNLKKYDWFSVKIAAWQYTDATDLTSTEGIRQTGTLVTGKNISVRPNNSNGKSTPMNGSVATLTWNRKDCTDFDAMVYGEWNGAGRMFKLTFYNSDAPVIIRIYDIEFGYNDIATDGTAIDLTSKFNAAANEITATFTPTGGTETAVTDVTAFTATQSGTLKVTIKKTGYKAVTYTITVNKE